MAKLPSVVSKLPNDLKQFIDRVREALSGTGWNRYVTAAELREAGVVDGPTSGSTLVAPGQNCGTPMVPTGLTATGALANVLLTWDEPGYLCHAFTEIWATDTDNLGLAVQVGMAPGAIFSHNIGGAATRYYWIRFVNTQDVKGPFNAVAGALGQTGQDPGYLLDLLEGEITESQLYGDLNDRIDLIDGADTLPGSVAARVKAETDARTLAISNTYSAFQLADSSLQQQIDLLSGIGSGGSIGDLITAISEETTARTLADQAFAAADSAIGTTVRANTSSLLGETGARQAVDSALTAISQTLTNAVGGSSNSLLTESAARASADAALANAQITLDGKALSTANALLSEYSARNMADATISNAVGAVGASLGATAASVKQERDERIESDYSTASFTTSVSAAFGTTAAGLSTEIKSRADADSATASQVTSLAAITSTSAAAITAEQMVRSSADSASATTATALAATVASNAAAITQEQSVRVGLDSATATSTNALTVSVAANAAAVSSESTARSDAESASASAIDRLAVATAAASAGIVNEQKVRSDENSAMASQISSLGVALDDKATVGALNSLALTVSDQGGELVAQAHQIEALEAAIDEAGVAADAALQIETLIRTSETEALATQATTLFAKYNENAAAIEQEALARADADSAEASLRTALAATVTGLDTTFTAAIQSEQSARADSDSATASQLDALGVSVGNSTAGIVSTQNASATADAAMASKVDAVASSAAGSASAVASEANSRSDAEGALAAQITTVAATTGSSTAAIQNEAQTRTTQDSAMASQVSSLGAAAGNSLAGLYSEQAARAAENSAEATLISGLSAAVKDNAADIISEANLRVTDAAAQATQLAAMRSVVGANAAAIASEQTTRADENSAMASQITNIGVTLGDKATVGALNALTVTVSDQGDELVAQAEQIDALAASIDALGVSADAAVQIETLVRTAETEALAQQDTLLYAKYNENAAAIIQEAQVRADADSAQALVSSTLQAQFYTRGAGPALNADPAFANSASWQSFSGAFPTFVTIADGAVGNTAARSSAGVHSWINERVRIPIDSAKSYRVLGRLRLVSGTGSTAYLGVALFDAAGVNISGDGTQWYYAAYGVTPGASWTSYNGDFGAGTAKTFPANARTMAPLAILSYGGGSAVHEVQDLRIEESTDIRALNAAITAESVARANAISAEAAQRNALAATVTSGDSNNASAIQSEQTARADSDSASAGQINSLLVVSGANAAGILEVQNASLSADVVQAAYANTLSSRLGDNAAAVLTEKNSRVTENEATASLVNAVSSAFGSSAAAIADERNTRTTADSAAASVNSGLTATTANATAGLSDFKNVVAAMDSATASALSSLSVATGSSTAGISGTQSASVSADQAMASVQNAIASAVGASAAAITTESSTRASADTNTASQITTLSTSVGSTSAALQTEVDLRSSETEALASQVTTLQAVREDDAAALELEAFVRNIETEGLLAQYTVKVDVNGYVSGYGLASSDAGGTPKSEFAVRADRFYVASPSGPGIEPTMPFVVQTTPTTINGVTVDPGVYMDGAYIENGTITNAKIGNAAIDDAKITSLSAGKVTFGEMSGDRITVSSLDANRIKTSTLSATSKIYAGLNNEVTIDGAGSISVDGVATKTVMESGNVTTYVKVGGAEYPYQALTHVELGVCQNNANVVIPGYFTQQPKVVVSPFELGVFKKEYVAQSQTLVCTPGAVSNVAGESYKWQFTPRATLSLLGADQSTAINSYSGTLASNNYVSSNVTTPGNASQVTVTVQFLSVRGTGTSGSYYNRKIDWSIDYSADGTTWFTGATRTVTIGNNISAYVSDTATRVFSSAGVWLWRVSATASDSGTTFSTGAPAYETQTVYKTGSATSDTLSTHWTGGYPQRCSGESQTIIAAFPGYTPPSGWSVDTVTYSATVSYSFTADTAPYAGVTVTVGGVYKGEFGIRKSTSLVGSYNYSQSTSSYVTNNCQAATSVYCGTSGSMSGTVSISAEAQINLKKPITNSTTPANNFNLISSNTTLSNAVVLAEGTLNWLAVGA